MSPSSFGRAATRAGLSLAGLSLAGLRLAGLCLAALACASLAAPAASADSPRYREPKRAPAAAAAPRLRVAYVEAGPYHDYRMNLLGLAIGLEELGIIENGRPPAANCATARDIWLWLSRNAGGDKLSFRPADFLSADWDEGRLEEIKRVVLGRAAASEIDLILALGTAAGQLLATAEHRTPTLSITATDPVAAGISLTEERSGLDHVHVQVQPGQIWRQLSMFHNVFRFETLGVPYDPAGDGSTMGLATIERLARELGFAVEPCPAELEISDVERAFGNLRDCLRRLSLTSQAVYLTVSNGMIEERLPELLAPMIERRLPTFSQRGPAETRLGALMSLAEEDFMSSGRFEAEVIGEILAGRRPGEISQIYVAPLTMALNIKMAMAIGWDPPFKVLAAVDELYTTMARPAGGPAGGPEGR